MSLLRLQSRTALRTAGPVSQRIAYRQAHKSSTDLATSSSIPPLRIFALPLSQSPTDSSKPLIYWHICQHSPSSQSANQTVSLDYKQPATWLPYGIDKASSTWLSWGEPPKTPENGEKQAWQEKIKGWKYWVWKNGERLMDKIEYEEWGLKSINPHIPALPKGIDFSGDAGKPGYQIPLLYPAGHPSLSATPDIAALLRSHLSERIPYHKRLLIRSLILLPFTLPVAALPVLPNLPGFYVAFRAYSHWKALQGATWLSKAIGKEGSEDRLRIEASDVLAGCFVTPSSTTASISAVKEDGINHESNDTAPDTTSTPTSYTTNTDRPLGMEFSGDTTAEKATNMTNYTHGTESTVPTASRGDQDDGVNHESKNVSFDTTSTPSSRIHPSQRNAPSPESSTANNTSQTTITSSTPIFTPHAAQIGRDIQTQSATDDKQAEIDSKIYLPIANVPRLVKAFELSPSEVVDVSRAVMQARLRLSKAAKADERQKST